MVSSKTKRVEYVDSGQLSGHWGLVGCWAPVFIYLSGSCSCRITTLPYHFTMLDYRRHNPVCWVLVRTMLLVLVKIKI